MPAHVPLLSIDRRFDHGLLEEADISLANLRHLTWPSGGIGTVALDPPAAAIAAVVIVLTRHANLDVDPGQADL